MMQPGWGLPPVPSSCQVRCAGCNGVLNVPAGVIEFRCPRCKLPQVLPPELLPPNLRPPVVQGIDPSKLQLPCRHCRSILNVPPGLSRFNCPQCKVEITVDQSKLLHPTFPLPSQPRKSRRLSPPPNNSKAHRNFSAPSSNNGKALADFWEPEPEPELIPESEPEEDSMDIESIDDKDETALETFTEYCPSKKGSGPPHPDPVVETSSLSAVQPPDVQYDLQIGQDIEKLKALSCLQFETVVLASQRHLQLLPDKTRAGFFLGDGAGVGKGRMIAALILENWQHGRRKAIWFSVSSDLQYDARRDLEDLGANFIKVHSLNKFPYTKLESKAAGVFDGVIFSTYSTLIASSESKKTRFEQLETWCGPEFDGMLVFDECHKAKNLIPDAGCQSSKTGEAVRDIQIKLPQARVVYCSATGASEPRNLAYMVRLGLWGEGTCFPRFENFSDALSRGGVGALELLAMEMKVRGMYVCRTLSYRSAEFEVVEVPLENSMNKIYTDSTRLWAELRVELEKAIKSWSEESQNNTLIWRLYWASQQRFFRHMCMAAKVPAVVELAKKALQENKCVVIGLQTTGEARIEEAMIKCGGELEDFVSGPKELLLKLVEDQYPLPQQPSEMLEDGTNGRGQKRQQAHRVVAIKGRMRKAARLKAFNNGLESDGEETESEEDSADSDDDFTICDICYKDEPIDLLVECCCCRKFVHSCCMTSQEKELLDGKSYCSKCKEKNEAYKKAYRAYNAEMWTRYEEAKKRKDTILEAIRVMNLPNNPLDDIIDQIGGPQQVAEITGRRGRLVRDANGKIVHQARNTKDIPTEMVNMHEKQLFMEGKKLVAVISEAGSAGLSFQADKRALNQRRRVHITLELPWSADRAIQQLGRTHRANQVSAPQYRLLFTNLGGERRFASIVAKRLESLGALTQGDRRAGPSLSAYNFDSRLGKDALNCMYTAILRQGDAPCLPPHYKNEDPVKIEHFYHQAKMALLTVGIIKDAKQGADQVMKTGGRILESDMKDVGRFLNRLLAIEPKIQNRIFEHFVDIFDILVMKARKEGEFDGGIVDVKANVIEVMDSKEVFKDSISHAATTLHRLKVERGMNWEDVHKLYEDLPKDLKDKSLNGFYESKREWYHRKLFLLALNCSKTSSTSYKIYRPANGENPREMHASELLDKYTMVTSLEKARIEWEKEFQRSADQCMHGPNCKAGASCFVGRRVQEMYVLGGLIFPVWKKVEKALSALERKNQRHLRIVRIETTSDNKRIVGLHVPRLAVASVLEGLSSAS